MITKIKSKIFFEIYIVTFLAIASFSSGDAYATEISVATTHREPFVFIEGDSFDGFGIDLWAAIAQENNWEYTLQDMQSFTALLKVPQEKTADIAIANISITSDRKELMDFSTPIFEGGLQIATQKKKPFNLFFDAMKVPQGHLILSIILFAFIVIIHITWLSERTPQGKVRMRYAPGIFDALWWVATLGGFGRALPQTGLGRFIFLVWMFVITIGLALYVSIITTALTAQDIKSSIASYQDLYGKKVGVVQGSIAEAFARHQRIDTVLYSDTEALFYDVALGYVDAVVHDAPLIQYYAKYRFPNQVELTGDIFQREVYGIAVPKDSLFLQDIDVALLRLREKGVYDHIYQQWFGEK